MKVLSKYLVNWLCHICIIPWIDCHWKITRIAGETNMKLTHIRYTAHCWGQVQKACKANKYIHILECCIKSFTESLEFSLHILGYGKGWTRLGRKSFIYFLSSKWFWGIRRMSLCYKKIEHDIEETCFI